MKLNFFCYPKNIPTPALTSQIHEMEFDPSRHSTEEEVKAHMTIMWSPEGAPYSNALRQRIRVLREMQDRFESFLAPGADRPDWHIDVEALERELIRKSLIDIGYRGKQNTES
jgi:hypothetical protein